ncbi:MAG: hypothetical protein AB7H43_02865 [Acidimicrobiia bacterium]
MVGRLRTSTLQLPEDDAGSRDADEDAWQALLDRGWSDGLPVVAPTPERVERMLGGREPDRVHVVLGGDSPGAMYKLGNPGAEATFGLIAANAVMAGCRPEYFPAVLAALSGVVANGNGAGFLGPVAPMLVFSGPVRRELGINCSHDMLSMVDRANATIGRAVRLVIRNVAGAKGDRLFDVQHGMPGRASMVFGEHEEESPWPPFVEGSAVTVFGAWGSMPVNYHQVPQRVEELRLILARCLDYVRGNRLGPWPDTSAVVVLSPKHARAFAAEGWSRAQVEDDLTTAVNDHHPIELPSIAEKLELINRGRGPDEPPLTIPMPEDRVRVLVAGGVAGWHSLMIPVRANAAPVTVPIV